MALISCPCYQIEVFPEMTFCGKQLQVVLLCEKKNLKMSIKGVTLSGHFKCIISISCIVCSLLHSVSAVVPRDRKNNKNNKKIISLRDAEICKKDRTGEEEEERL